MKTSFDFVELERLENKPRKEGLTEIRGPYYEAFTVAQFESLLHTWGHYIDGLKFAGGVQALLAPNVVKQFTKLAHDNEVYVNTGGFIERILIDKKNRLDDYLKETKALGFDVVEVSSGMFFNNDDFPLESRLNVVKKIKEFGLQPKPEITLMTGVGGGVKEFSYQEGHQEKSLDTLLIEAERFFEAGAESLMIESEGITEGIEDPANWRKDVIEALIKRFGHERLMFEISPEDDEARRTFKWYLKEVHPKINLMMNAKNIVEFNAWRAHLWGDRELWKGKKVSI